MSLVGMSLIAFDAGTQIRAALNEQVVAEYADAMSYGAVFPPIVLFHDGNQHYLADGFHRFMAAQRLQWREIDADVRAGSKEDALWFALGANKTNGQRMTDADKRHAVAVALQAWPDKSASIIAEQIGCSKQYVAGIRNEVSSALHLPERVTGVDGRSYPASPAARVSAREKARSMLSSGSEPADVQRETGIGRDTVNSLKRELGITVDKSRAGVAQRRKDIRDMAARGYTSRQIAEALSISDRAVVAIAKDEQIVIHADRVVGKSKRHDSNRIVDQMVMDAENLTADVNLIDFSQLDSASIATWVTSLTVSRDKFNAFIRRLKEQQKHGEAA